jgi:hypothetical protein
VFCIRFVGRACDPTRVTSPTRTVHHADALDFLRGRALPREVALVTSMPDISELSIRDLSTYKRWFFDAGRLCLEAVHPESVAIFFQSDIKVNGVWLDKGYLVQRAAEESGVELLWHKIVCRAPAGTTTFGRPAYSHMLCFSRALRADPSRSTPDVVPAQGKTLWSRGMGVEACFLACRWLVRETNCSVVLDPFCGVGTTLACANALALDAIGVELSRKRAERAARLELPPEP